MGGAYTGSHKQKMFEKYINISSLEYAHTPLLKA